MADPREPDEADGQDLAEVFDEENITPDGRDIATSDMEPDVYDATSSDEDADIDDAHAPDDDFDPDAMDEAEYEAVVQGEEDLDEPRSFARSDADRVSDEDLQPDDLEPDGADVEELDFGGDEAP
jgi:hypothetical protein